MKGKINNLTYRETEFNNYYLISKEWITRYKKYYHYNEISKMKVQKIKKKKMKTKRKRITKKKKLKIKKKRKKKKKVKIKKINLIMKKKQIYKHKLV